jgi:hypothetical protein
MSDPVARLLEMRLRFRHNPEARAVVDRCLVLVARGLEDDTDDAALDREVSKLADDLALRFGAPSGANAH